VDHHAIMLPSAFERGAGMATGETGAVMAQDCDVTVMSMNYG